MSFVFSNCFLMISVTAISRIPLIIWRTPVSLPLLLLPLPWFPSVQRLIVTVVIVGELFKRRLIGERIIHAMIRSITQPSEINIRLVCNLLKSTSLCNFECFSFLHFIESCSCSQSHDWTMFVLRDISQPTSLASVLLEKWKKLPLVFAQ